MENLRNLLRPVNPFVKHSILDIWQGSWYAFVICYSLFEKIEIAITGLSMNTLHRGDKSPVQRGFFKSSAGDCPNVSRWTVQFL